MDNVKTELPDDFEMLVFEALKRLSALESHKEAGVSAQDIIDEMRKLKLKEEVSEADIARTLSRMEKEGMAVETVFNRYVAFDYDPTWGVVD